jgi:hypothetical protein
MTKILSIKRDHGPRHIREIIPEALDAFQVSPSYQLTKTNNSSVNVFLMKKPIKRLFQDKNYNKTTV